MNFIAVSSVTFNNVAATTSTVNSPTQITATVPASATSGQIRVTTLGGTGSSLTDFTVAAPVSTNHSTGVTLSLKRHLVVRGTVTVEDDTAECLSGVTVKIQRRKGGRWRKVETTTTNDAGAYGESIRDRVGRYRAVVPRVTLADEQRLLEGRLTCPKAQPLGPPV
jgi:hypothetical protein